MGTQGEQENVRGLKKDEAKEGVKRKSKTGRSLVFDGGAQFSGRAAEMSQGGRLLLHQGKPRLWVSYANISVLMSASGLVRVNYAFSKHASVCCVPAVYRAMPADANRS